MKTDIKIKILTTTLTWLRSWLEIFDALCYIMTLHSLYLSYKFLAFSAKFELSYISNLKEQSK